MFAQGSTPWKCRHRNSDKEQLLLYMCARSSLQTISMYVSWQVGSWIPVLYLRHRCLSTVQYLCFCKLSWSICTVVSVDFDHTFFSQAVHQIEDENLQRLIISSDIRESENQKSEEKHNGIAIQ